MTLTSSRFGLSLAALLTLSACAAVGPEPTDLPTPRLQGTFAEAEGAPLGRTGANAFWSGYQDRLLSQLIAEGLGTSLDIIAANERIRAAEADLAATAPLAAQITGDASAARTRSGGDGRTAATGDSASLSAGFVFDLFGGARRARQGAAAGYASAEAQAEVTRLAWLAEVIRAYADARFAQEALSLTRETLRAREQTLGVTREMSSLGLATSLDIAQTEALLATARADLPNYEAQFNAQVFRLSTLLNQQAGPLLGRMQGGSAGLRIPPGPGTGVPAELLVNRPDLRAARSDLARALAQVGVAEADMLPSLGLSGTVSDSGGATGWSFGPRISLPVNQGALQAARNRRVSEARQADLAWRSGVAAAVEDVQTRQSNLRRFRQRVAALEEASRSYDRAYALARENFDAGATTLVDLLDADRQRAAARLQVASARNQAAKEWAALQIATGAGAAVVRTDG